MKVRDRRALVAPHPYRALGVISANVMYQLAARGLLPSIVAEYKAAGMQSDEALALHVVGIPASHCGGKCAFDALNVSGFGREAKLLARRRARHAQKRT